MDEPVSGVGQLSEVIGEGTYGCVHKPSLKCKSKKVNYKDKISKLMLDEYAKTELKEYKTIDKIDPEQQIYLGKPMKCKVNLDNRENRFSIYKCKEGEKLLKEVYPLSLLIMEDGGINLAQYAKEIDLWKSSKGNREKIEKLWIEAYRILYGLYLFDKYGVVHHDLKPQNIVFDEDKNRMNFIDFGLMTDKKKIIQNSKKNKNGFAILHWSFPLESSFYNQKDFNFYKSKPVMDKVEFYNRLAGNTVKDNDYIKTFLYYSFRESPNLLKRFYDDLQQFLVYEFKSLKYSDFIEQSLRTFDIYGVGISFIHLLQQCQGLIPDDTYDSLEELFYRMITPNLTTRITIEPLLDDYEVLLSKYGLLEKHHYYLSNHILYQGEMPLKDANTSLKPISIVELKISPKKIEEIVSKTPMDQFSKSNKDLQRSKTIINLITPENTSHKQNKKANSNTGSSLHKRSHRTLKNSKKHGEKRNTMKQWSTGKNTYEKQRKHV
jgi:serine/threonine protein kinase